MKRGKQIHIHFHFSNRIFYSLIAFGILIVVGISVYAYGSGSPTTSGHTGNEISVDSSLCSAVTGHGCGYDVDTRGVSGCSSYLYGCGGYLTSVSGWGYRGCPPDMVANQFYTNGGSFAYVWCCRIGISCS